MVNLTSVFFIFISFLLSFIFPFVLLIYMKKKYKTSLVFVLAGAIIFAVFQLIVRIPLIGWLNGNFWFYTNVVSNNVLYGLFLAFTAGLFEESGRYLAFRLIGGRINWANSVGYGIGHGGFESVALIGTTYLANLIAVGYLNYGLFGNIINWLPQIFNNMEAIKEIFRSTPSYYFLLGGIERVMTIIIHIALSLLVAKSFIRKKPLYLLYAILIHTLINLAAVFSPNILIAEFSVLIFALISGYYINESKYTFGSW
ncbi:MAG: YhfC family intramembrane metalloprotease [Eubacteriaceae bacterium]|nr:YhfC family intramembrane metalloprotease [Eubacteriaceae bacterium]